MTLEPKAQDANGHTIRSGDSVSLTGRVTAVNPGTISVILDDGVTEATVSKSDLRYLTVFNGKVGELVVITGTIVSLEGYGQNTVALVDTNSGISIIAQRNAIQR
jgi:hypothetical protein